MRSRVLLRGSPRGLASDYASVHGTTARRLARGHRPMFPLPPARESDRSRRRTARAVARRSGRGAGRERGRAWETIRRACRREPSCGARSRRYRCGVSSFHECDAVLSGQGCHGGRVQSPIYGSNSCLPCPLATRDPSDIRNEDTRGWWLRGAITHRAHVGDRDFEVHSRWTGAAPSTRRRCRCRPHVPSEGTTR